MGKKKDDKKGRSKVSEAWIIAITGIVAAVLTAVIIEFFIPYLQARKNRPDTRINIIDSGDEIKRYFFVSMNNRGTGIDKKIKVQFNLYAPSYIKDIKINDKEKIRLSNADKNHATFYVDELYPRDLVLILIEGEGKDDYSLRAWSDKSGELKKISMESPFTVKWGAQETEEQKQNQ